MEQCIVCLETKKHTFSRISTASSEWIGSKMRNVIEKHLWWWYLESPSYNNGLARWICCECWQEISAFNRFYVKIESAHRNLNKILSVSMSFTKRQEEETIGKLEENNSVKSTTALKLPEERQRKENVEEIAECVDNFEEEIISIVEIKNELCVSSFALNINAESPNTNLHYQQIDENDNAINEMLTDEDESLIINGGQNKSKLKVHAGRTKKELTKEKNTKSVKENLACETVPSNEAQSDEDEPLIKKLNITKSENISKRKVHADRNNKEATKETNKKSLKLKENLEWETVHKLECCICKVPLADFRSLKSHYRTEHNTRGYTICCGKKFFERCLLVDHLKVHADPHFFKCHLCTKTYATRSVLERHLETHKIRERVFNCDDCCKSFFKLYMLERHKMTHVPESEKKYNCLQCEKKFASDCLRRRHVDAVHSKKYGKTCDICGKIYCDTNAFLCHMDEHAGIYRAMETCNICGVEISNKHRLRRHMKLQHLEENLKEQICPHCSKISPNMGAHLRHIYNKHNKHVCHICNKAFKYQSRLKKHLSTTHTGEALYTCPHCPRKFRTAANKNKHRKVVHRKEWELSRKKKFNQYAGNTISDDVGEKTEDAQKTSQDLVISTESGINVYTVHF